MTRMNWRAGALVAFALLGGAWLVAESVRADEPAASDAAEAKDWTEHMGKLPFVVGREAGEAEAEFTGRPPMYFFTTTW